MSSSRDHSTDDGEEEEAEGEEDEGVLDEHGGFVSTLLRRNPTHPVVLGNVFLTALVAGGLGYAGFVRMRTGGVGVVGAWRHVGLGVGVLGVLGTVDYLVSS